MAVVELRFDAGTLVATSLPDDPALHAHFVKDERVGLFRAPGWKYREIALAWHRARIEWKDSARAFEPMALDRMSSMEPRPYQREALEAWTKAGSRGVVVLPTGAGKTLFAMLAMERTRRPTLIVVPTIDLMHQWHGELTKHFAVPIGRIGGGISEREAITVTTYDSAQLHIEHHGGRFGLLIFDEAHHLPGPAVRWVAQAAIAPFRLGLTATPERQDAGERVLYELVGPIVHRVDIDELEGKYLAPYEVVTEEVALTAEEQIRYDEARRRYVDFLRAERISMGGADGWRMFLIKSSRTPEGREAFRAYREQRRIATASRAKLDTLWRILVKHREERTLVFTEDNETVYLLSRWLLAPALTHHTPPLERRALLAAFSSGDLPVLLTSKVLNEGVDVPEASVGVVMSGSGSVREHVQRLGRILRAKEGKRATLYEIRSAGTAEGGISERRRAHKAYQRDES